VDPERFARGMTLLGAVFDPALPDELARRRQASYRLAVDDLDGEEFEAACLLLVNTLRFFPKPVELREAVIEVRRRRGHAARAEEYAERLALTEARERAQQEVAYGVWDAERGVAVRSGEPAEVIHERWRRLAVARLEQWRAARERGEAPDDA
jgi:hypothetical protein